MDCNLTLHDEKELPPVPLEDNKEFRSIKNEIIKYAAEIAETPEAQLSSVYHRSALRMLAVSLGKLLADAYVKRQKKLQSQIDKRLQSKIELKKAAQGIKTDFSAQDQSWGPIIQESGFAATRQALSYSPSPVPKGQSAGVTIFFV